MTATPVSSPSDRLGRNYRSLFGAATISNLGDGVALVAYPWLASAITRNALLIAIVAVVQRLPWLLFSLPAGVLTDRHDRRRLMIVANAARAAITLFVAIAVVSRGTDLPGPNELDTVVSTDTFLYVCVVVATFLLGIGEVLYDNCAQTMMPSLVRTDQLEKANGRIWAAQEVANQFAGPPVGSLLLAAGFAVPFVLDAGSFVVSAALISTITLTPPTSAAVVTRRSWRDELVEGVRWLWENELLRTLAIVLALFNGAAAITFSIYVLFAQEILGASSGEFAAIMMAGAAGAVIGGWTGSSLSRKLGSGPSLAVALGATAASEMIIGLLSNVPAVAVLNLVAAFFAVLWNVITVSLRQSIVPDHLLGRVNSVYRFFAWGVMPIGAIVGGVIVVVTERVADRELALRLPWIISGATMIGLLVYATPRLTTRRLDAARAARPLAGPT
ncbi:MAG TPA: MFS transporter [Desertimonas sp.]|nr:MFS transporter [Desertimonas sp.]